MLCVGLFLVVWLTSQHLVGQSPEAFIPDLKSDERLDRIGEYLSAMVASADQAISMLVTLQLSLFVVVGFVLRDALTTGARPTLAQILLGVVFLGFAFASVTLGYAARMLALNLINHAHPEFSAVEATVVRQALLVTVSAIAAVCMAVVTLFDTRHAPSQAGPVAEAATPRHQAPTQARQNHDASGRKR